MQVQLQAVKASENAAVMLNAWSQSADTNYSNNTAHVLHKVGGGSKSREDAPQSRVPASKV